MTRGTRKCRTAVLTISSLLGELWGTELRKWAQESNTERAGIRQAATGCFEGVKGSEKSRFSNLVSKILFEVKLIFVVILVSRVNRFSFPEP